MTPSLSKHRAALAGTALIIAATGFAAAGVPAMAAVGTPAATHAAAQQSYTAAAGGSMNFGGQFGNEQILGGRVVPGYAALIWGKGPTAQGSTYSVFLANVSVTPNSITGTNQAGQNVTIDGSNYTYSGTINPGLAGIQSVTIQNLHLQ